MLRTIYEKHLLGAITRDGEIPGHVALVLAETDLLKPRGTGNLAGFTAMCQKLRIREISIYIDILDTDPALKKEMEEKITASLKDMFSGLPVKPRYTIYNNEGVPEATGGDEPPDVNILAGFGGKKEITKAVCSILEAVETGELSPEDITGGLIEQNLTIKSEPDLIIRAGGKHLSDFLIWQSVYSELYFTDVSWENFRKIDFYRIIRDFQKRQRRYGK